MSDQVDAFADYREEMNKKLLDNGNLTLKRIFHLDGSAYQDGALSRQTKELLGLMGSMVLRCDDCIRYHLGKCYDEEVTKDQILEVFSIAMVVGGTIVIPHTRRAMEYWEILEQKAHT